MPVTYISEERKTEHKMIKGILLVERLAYNTECCRLSLACPRMMTEHRTTREKVKLGICDAIILGGNPWREKRKIRRIQGSGILVVVRRDTTLNFTPNSIIGNCQST